MGWFIFGAGTLFILLGFASLAFPQQIWWATQAWKYRSPEANEPSVAGYLVRAARPFGVGLIFIFVDLWRLTG